jgi:hypothetical protein
MSIKMQCLRQFGNAFTHIYNVHKFSRKIRMFLQFHKTTVYLKTVLDRAYFKMDCGLVTDRLHPFLGDRWGRRIKMWVGHVFKTSFKYKLFLKHTIYKNSIYKVYQLITKLVLILESTPFIILLYPPLPPFLE